MFYSTITIAMRINIRLYLIPLIIVFFDLTVFSKELELTISDSIDRALTSNLDIQLAQSVLDKLTWDNSWKWTSLFPSFIVSVGLSRSNTEPKVAQFNSKYSQWGLNRNISISSPIGPLLIKKILKTFGTYISFKKGEITYENAIKKILISVQKAYYDILIAKKELVILERQLKINIEQNDNLTVEYESGLVEEYDYLQSQIKRLQLEQQVNEKKNSILDFSNNLAHIIGEEKGTQFILVEDVPDINEDAIKNILIKNSLDNTYDLKVAELDNSVFNITQYASLLSLLPTLNLRWQNTRSFQGNPWKKAWFNDNNWADDSGSLAFDVSFNISNSLPGSPAFLEYINAKTEYKKHIINVKKTIETLGLKLVKLQNTLQLQVQTLDVSKNQRDLSRKAFDIMQTKYDNGLALLTEYQTAENNLLDAEKKYLSNTISIVKSILDIQILLGEENVY